jgi:FMN-dependent dehydrogenase
VQVAANRENNLRNGFTIPLRPSLRLLFAGLRHPSWTLGTWVKTFLVHGMPHFENMDAFRGPPPHPFAASRTPDRRGSDVIKALAMGADFVFVGRPFVFSAAIGRDRGVNHAITLLAAEIDRNMAMLGIRDLGELSATQLLFR